MNPERPELKRFEGIVGRVVTVNCNNKAVVDFQDGGWYDIAASEEYLAKLDPAAAKAKYKATPTAPSLIREARVRVFSVQCSVFSGTPPARTLNTEH